MVAWSPPPPPSPSSSKAKQEMGHTSSSPLFWLCKKAIKIAERKSRALFPPMPCQKSATNFSPLLSRTFQAYLILERAVFSSTHALI